jgi:hypothetical protein
MGFVFSAFVDLACPQSAETNYRYLTVSSRPRHEKGQRQSIELSLLVRPFPMQLVEILVELDRGNAIQIPFIMSCGLGMDIGKALSLYGEA